MVESPSFCPGPELVIVILFQGLIERPVPLETLVRGIVEGTSGQSVKLPQVELVGGVDDFLILIHDIRTWSDRSKVDFIHDHPCPDISQDQIDL